jgi:hypothetical protein
VVDAEREKVVCVWRAIVPCPRRLLEIDKIVISETAL